jgi:hypothetical protein
MDTDTPTSGDVGDQDAEPTMNAPDDARPDGIDTGAGSGGQQADETPDGHPS